MRVFIGRNKQSRLTVPPIEFALAKAQQLRRDSDAIRADNLVEEIVLNLVGVF